MRTYLLPTQDATIYQRYPLNNAGLDEILEVGKLIKPLDTDVMYASSSVRSLLQFDISNIQSYDISARFFLNLYIAEASKVNRYQKLEIYPISRSWNEGSGYFYQTVQNSKDGATWTTTDKNNNWITLGGDYLTDVSGSFEFVEVPIQDVKIEITNIMLPFVFGSSSFDWNGLIIKYPNTDETDSTNEGNIKFFSSNTHTIFSPTLEVVWNNQTFATGSLKPIPSSNVSIIPKNIKESYTRGEVEKIYLVVRDAYPDKRYDEVQRYRNQYYLPSQSYYRITDEVSGIKLYDFDNYSAINCDVSGSYILLDTSGFDVNRYYKLELKISSGNQMVFFPEFSYSFKVDSNG